MHVGVFGGGYDIRRVLVIVTAAVRTTLFVSAAVYVRQ